MAHLLSSIFSIYSNTLLISPIHQQPKDDSFFLVDALILTSGLKKTESRAFLGAKSTAKWLASDCVLATDNVSIRHIERLWIDELYGATGTNSTAAKIVA